jgi:hypothetical protein
VAEPAPLPPLADLLRQVQGPPVESPEERGIRERRALKERRAMEFQMSKKSVLAKLIATFNYDDKPHRLIAKAKATPGYEDSYVIEKQGVDELGDTRWDNYTVFNNDNHNRGTELRLIAALKEAQREQRGDVIEKVAAYIHRSAEAVEDPGTRAALVALADGVLEGRAFQ